MLSSREVQYNKDSTAILLVHVYRHFDPAQIHLSVYKLQKNKKE